MMKQKIVLNLVKTVFILAVLTVSAGSGTLAATIRKADVTSASDDTVLVGVEGTFYAEEADEILALINGYRKEACKEGVIDPGTGRAFTEEDYKPLEWSTSLEGIAQMRAAEGMMYLDHTRPNGKQCFTCYSSLLNYYGFEVLAWNGNKSSQAIIRGIQQWYAEKDNYVNNVSGAVTGHYTSMIRSDVNYIGIGCFDIKNDTSGWVCVAGEISKSSPLADTDVVNQGEYEQIIEVTASNIEQLNMSGDIRLAVNDKRDTVLNAKISYSSGSRVNATSNTRVIDGVRWTSSNTDVAEVSNKGVITAKAKGTAIITAQVGTKSANITVTVAEPQEAENLSVLTVEAFQKPVLPDRATVKWSDGVTTQELISWNEDKNDYSAYKGEDYRVEGKVSGLTIYQDIVMEPAEYVRSDFDGNPDVTADVSGQYFMNVPYGQKPELPTEVNVTWKGYQNATKKTTEEIEWDSVRESDYKQHRKHTFIVKGHVSGSDVSDEDSQLFEVGIAITQEQAGYEVIEPGDIETEYGVTAKLPELVRIIWIDKEEEVLPIAWQDDWETINADILNKEEGGEFAVTGTVDDTHAPLIWNNENDKSVKVKVVVSPKKYNSEKDDTTSEESEEVAEKDKITEEEKKDEAAEKEITTEEEKKGDETTEKDTTTKEYNDGGKITGGTSSEGKDTGSTVNTVKTNDSENTGKSDITDGSTVLDVSTGAQYEADVSGSTITLIYTGSTTNEKTVVIPDNIVINGTTYKVTAVDNNAFKQNPKLKKVTIGKNISRIGKDAFNGCKNLKTISIKSSKLTRKSFGKNAFKNINKKATISVPKKQYKSYRKWLKSAGLPKTVKIKKK